MPNLTIADYLRYADLQMAAEAFLAVANESIKANLQRVLAV